MSSKPLRATSGDFFLASLGAFMRRNGQGLNYGVTVLRLKGRPDHAELVQAWRDLYRLHPVLNARLKRRFRDWKLVWEPRSPVDPPPVVWHDAGKAEPSPETIKSRMAGISSTGPARHAITLEVFPPSKNYEWTVLVVWNHSLLDGAGVNLLLEYLAPGSSVQPLPAPETAAPAPAERLSIGKLFKLAKPAVNSLKEVTRAGSRSAWTRRGSLEGGSEYRVIELSPFDSGIAFANSRKFCGEIFQMPYYAAIAARAVRVLHQHRGWSSPVYHLQVPFQASRRPGNAVFQNQMKTLLLALREASLSTLESTVTHVMSAYKDALRSRLPQAFDSLMDLMTLLPVKLFIPFIRHQNEGEICSLFHSHTGTFLPGCDTFAGARIANVYSIPGVSNPPGLGVFLSDFCGIISVVLSWRSGVLSGEEVDLIGRQIVADLTGPCDKADAHGKS